MTDKSLEDQIEDALARVDKLDKELTEAKKELNQLVKRYSWDQGFISPLRIDNMRAIIQRRKANG